MRLQHHLIPSVHFALVQLLIRLFQDGGRGGAEIVFRHADGDGDRERCALIFQPQPFHGLLHAEHDHARLVQVFAGNKKAEFFSAPAAHAVTLRGQGLEQVGQGFQGIVAAIVAVGVVDIFEEVDIGNGDAVNLIGRALQQLQHGAAVGQAGEGIGVRFLAQLLVVDAQLPFRGLQVAAEMGEAHSQHHEGIQAGDGLHHDQRAVAQQNDGGMNHRVGKQPHAHAEQEKEGDDFLPRLVVDIKKTEHQRGDQQMLPAAGPAEGEDVPAAEDDKRRLMGIDAHQRVHPALGPDARQHGGHHHQRKGQPLMRRPAHQNKGRGQKARQQHFAHHECVLVIGGHVLSGLGHMLVQKLHHHGQQFPLKCGLINHADNTLTLAAFPSESGGTAGRASRRSPRYYTIFYRIEQQKT